MHRLLFVALACTARAGDGAPLTVTVTDVRTGAGTLFVALENTEAGWNFQAESVAQARVQAVAGSLTHVFEDIAPGTYAVMVIHDENGNGKLDSNFLGIPSEGYGFSRNPRTWRRATFEEASFELPAEGTAITIDLR